MTPLSSSRIAFLLVLGTLLAPSAWAQSDLIALHPCAILEVKDKQQVSDLQLTCATEIARGDVQLVSSDLVRAFLDKEAKGSCARAKKPTECLGKLATATQASRAVLITVKPGPLTRVSGLVVNPRGEVVDQKSIQLRLRGQQTEGELFRTAITRLREQLNLIPLKIAPLVEQPPPPPLVATPTPEPTPAPALTEPPPPVKPAAPPEAIAMRQQAPGAARTWKTRTAYASAGVGVAALGVATWLAIDGNNAMLKSNEYYANNKLPVRDELADIVALRKDADTKRILSGVSAGVGAGLIGLGAYFWLGDRSASLAPSVAALSVGPGGVSIVGTLP